MGNDGTTIKTDVTALPTTANRGALDATTAPTGGAATEDDGIAAVDSYVPPRSGRFPHFYLGKGNTEGWRRLLKVDPSLRSWLSGTMIYVETTLEFFEKLTAEEITVELQEKLGLVSRMFQKIVQNLKSPYLDNGSLSLLGLERMQNMLFREQRASVVRLNINMTDANKADPSGNLGTAYKYAVLQWLQEEFGERHISLNPEGSSFLAINVSLHEMSCSLSRFDREIRDILETEEMYERYDYDPRLLAEFIPFTTGMFKEIRADGLDVEKEIAPENTDELLDRQQRVIARIEESLRLLAVGTTIAEKDPAAIGLASGLSVYRDVYEFSDLPKNENDPGYELLREQLKLGMGYVPASVFRCSYVRGTPVIDKKFEIHPRYGHDFGRLDHRERPDSPGGALQILQKAIFALSAAKIMKDKEIALRKLRKASDDCKIALEIGRIARSNPRNPMFIKWMQEIKLSDNTRLMDSYFVERVALREEDKVHLVVLELDSFKAFSAEHPIDEVDSNFWRVFEHFAIEAEAREIDMPLITQVAGDLVALAVPVIGVDGKEIDIGEYVKSSQRRIADAYADRPFQDMMKDEVWDGSGYRVERLPLWRDKDGELKSAKVQPQGCEPFMNTLTVTAMAATLPTPRSHADKVLWEHNIARMAYETELLKERTAPQKGDYAYHEISAPTRKTPFPTPFGGVATPPVKQINRIAERFRTSIDEQMSEALGDTWARMNPVIKETFVGIIEEEAPSSPAVMMPNAVGAAFAMASGMEAEDFPSAPMLFLPLTAGIHAL